MNFIVDALNINYSNIQAAFSFRSNPIINTNIVYSDPWASGASSGILNTIGGNGFFINSGTGTFNGTNYFKLNQNYSLNNSTILLSYEKLRNGNEILISSATGTFYNNFSGFNIGINDANKLYLKYWNDIEGSFTFTYTGILSDKNIIVINRSNSIITLGHFNNNNFKFTFQEFEIYQNRFLNSSNLFIGGNPNTPNWDKNNPTNFSGYIDRLYIFNNIPLVYADILSRGFFSEPTGFAGDLEEYCYVTGFLSGSGFSYSTTTGVLVSGFQSGVTGITGYQEIISGYSFTGITGYSGRYLGSYIDNCGRNIDITEQVALSGVISNEILISVGLTGITYVTGFIDVPLVAVETGIQNVFVTGLICDSYFNNIGDVLYAYDNKYLESLSYKEMSLLTQVNPNNIEPTGNDIIEIYAENYQPKTLEYNKNLTYDNLNENYFYIDKEFKQNEVLMFGNGQALIDDGYELIPSGYEIIRSPNFDYFITGTTVETNKFFGVKDYLFYDFFSGKSSFFPMLNNNAEEVFYQSNNKADAFVFKNGQKLISGIDYSVNKQNFTQVLYGSGTNARFGSNLNINDDGDLLVTSDKSGITAIANNCYIYKKIIGNSWVLHQTITGLLKFLPGYPNFQTKLSRNGKVLVVRNDLSFTGSRIDIFTGSKNDYWYLSKTFNISGSNVNLNYDGSIINYYRTSQDITTPWRVDMGIITGNPNLGNWNFHDYQNVTSSSLFSWPSAINSGIPTIQLYVGISVIQNKNMDKSMVIFSVVGGNLNAFLAVPYINRTFIKIGTGNMFNWNSTQNISGAYLPSETIDLNPSIRINDNFSVMSIAQTSFPTGGLSANKQGRVAILTGAINSQWKIKQSLTGEFDCAALGLRHAIDDNGENIFISSGNFCSLRKPRVMQYQGNVNNGWSNSNNFDSASYPSNQSLTSMVINQDGSKVVTAQDFASTSSGADAGVLHIFEQGMNLYFLNEDFANQLNYFMVREINHNNNYLSGNSGTLKFNYPFNHGCSQVYYNGIKQRINSNYIENSRHDLLSGTFNEPNEFQELIYNNTNDFFV